MTRRFTATFFLAVITFFMCFSIVSLVVKQVDKKIRPKPAEEITHIMIDWEKLYPFDDGIKHQTPSEVKNIYTYIKTKLEDYTSKHLIGYHALIETAKKYEDFINWDIVHFPDNTNVIKLNDGFLANLTVSSDVSSNASSVIDFARYCEEQSIKLFYINIPSKICRYEDEYLSGTLDFSNQNADRFLALLEDSGIKHYDLREILHDEGMKHHEAFYVTDHHWKPETGLWAARHILSFLREDYGIKIDIELLDDDMFDYVKYPEWFLGSWGKRFTLSRIKPDDFIMIYPKYATMLDYEIPDKGIKTSGDFEITYDMTNLTDKNYYDKNPYAAYDYADRPLIRLHNLQNRNGKKLLLLHESFGNCVIPFLSLGIEYIDAIDLRHFTGSLQTYIKQNEPEIVIVMYNTAYTGLKDNDTERKRVYIFR